MLHHANRASLATTRDPNFRNVTLLLHGDGTNGGQNNTFIDGSTNNFTITRNGNTTQGSFSPFSQTGWSNYFDGNGDYLTVPANAAFQFGTGDFTIECWVNKPAAANGPIVDARGSATAVPYAFYIDASNFPYFYDGTIYTSTVAIVNNQWNHVAVVKTSGTLKMFVNGVEGYSAAYSTTLNPLQTIYIGGQNFSTSAYTTGYISNLRIVKGTAVYTAAFTPPTSPLTAITNTSLLTCQSNRLIDNSSNAFTITRNGDVSVQRFNPFNPPGEYSTSIIGGSGYFDGTGDYLTVPNNTVLNMGTSDFTLEAWIYLTATPGAASPYGGVILDKDGLIFTSWAQYAISVSSARRVVFQASATPNAGINPQSSIVGATTIALNTWYHVAVTRSGANATLWLNGASDGTTASVPTNLTTRSSNLLIGWTDRTNPDSTFNFPGYISNLRIVKGSRVYTANFTPPTSPLTAITNTSLLLNFTNASIIDNAMINDLESVGNAQISTSIRRFGTGSLAFDGTGDWLLIPHAPDQFFNTGNFTIEMWLYLATTGAARGLVAKGTGTTGWLVSTNASNQVVFTFGTSTITSTGTISGTTWTHIAVVREGTGTNQTKIYINGTNDGTGTVSTNFNQTNAMYVGADRTAGSALNGNIDDLRISNGIARYTANFTPPTVPFPNM